MRLKSLTGALVFGMCSAALADHACIESLPRAEKMKLHEHLPAKWFLVGDASIIGPALHASLKERFGNQYVESHDEGYSGYVCVKYGAGFVTIANSSYGPSARWSAKPPQCLRCNNADMGPFQSGTGLQIGQTKAEVSALVGQKIANDLVDLLFEEEERGPPVAYHMELLSLQFERGSLVRFEVNDYREGA